jgi:hypothetical protein
MLMLWLGALGTRQLPWTVLVLGGLLLALYGARAVLGPRPRWFALRLWAVIVMLAMTIAESLVLAPRVAVSMVLLLVTIATGVGLAWAEVKDTP